jgi:hypothetical protein
MEIIKSRYGSERSVERVDFQRIRIMGDSEFTRKSKNENGDVNMYDFEGGPAYTIGMKMSFEGMSYRIEKIVPIEVNHKDFCEVILYVKQLYGR